MKKSLRLLALLLVMVTCATLLAACGDKGSTTTPATTTSPSGGDSTLAKWNDHNYSDTGVRIFYNDYVTKAMSDAGAGNSLLYIKGPDELSGASRGDYKAAYERHARVAAALDLTIGENLTYMMANWDSNCDHILTDIRGLVDAHMEGVTPTVIIHQNYGMVRAGILGLFYNALDDEEENYLDLSDDGWYRGMMEENTIDTSKIYMLMGDYTIDQLRFAMGILVNKGIADDALSLYGGLAHIHSLVENGTWTYDAMMELASYASNADSGVTGDDLIMGVVSDQWIVRNLFASSGLDIFKRDTNGEAFYVQGTEIDPIHDWITKMISMEKETYFAYNWASDPLNPSKTSPATTFVNGGSLFALSQMVLTLEGSLVQDMTNPAGILPNPKYIPNGEEITSDTNYGALVSDNANSAGILITSSSREFTAASAFLQAMTENSDEFFQKYFTEGLQKRNNSIGPKQVTMLNFIHDGICSPMSFMYDNYCAKTVGGDSQTYGAMIYNSINNLSNTFASDWAGQINGKVSRWETIKANYGRPTAAGQ